jgi:hypothetical protein
VAQGIGPELKPQYCKKRKKKDTRKKSIHFHIWWRTCNLLPSKLLFCKVKHYWLWGRSTFKEMIRGFRCSHLKIFQSRVAAVAFICNPSYFRGWDEENGSLRLARAKLARRFSQNTRWQSGTCLSSQLCWSCRQQGHIWGKKLRTSNN